MGVWRRRKEDSSVALKGVGGGDFQRSWKGDGKEENRSLKSSAVERTLGKPGLQSYKQHNS